jgi:acetyltransferase EpsM
VNAPSSPAIELYVAGAGGHGRELHAYLEDLRRAGWQGRLQGYLDDGLAPGVHRGLEVVAAIEGIGERLRRSAAPARYITAFGSNGLRRKIVEQLSELYGERLSPWSLVHPRAYVGNDVTIGEGTCLAPAALVTARAAIGRHCILNVKASVSHDCALGDFVNVNPGATICGNVTIGEGAYVGAGATIKENITVGAWSVIGAGAVVVHDVPPNVTVAGVPARRIGVPND